MNRSQSTGSEKLSCHETNKKPNYYYPETFSILLARLATQTLAWINETMNAMNTRLSKTRARGYAGPLHSIDREFAVVSCTVETFLACVFRD